MLSMKNDITYCFLTTTKGHWGIRDRYKTTAQNILKHLPSQYWSEMIAHIKVSSDDQAILFEMRDYLRTNGFKVLKTDGNWDHNNQSHQIEYLKDMRTIVNEVKSNYIFFAEDDFLIDVKDVDFAYWLNWAQQQLANNPDIMQVRIPRFQNEDKRINLLYKKHGIMARAEWSADNKYFKHNDFSNNPHLTRTRDMRAALRLVEAGLFESHSEHGTGKALKFLSHVELPLICPNPEKIRCLHIGTKLHEEDKFNEPTIEKLIE